MSEEQQLRQRAARRWRWRLILPGLFGGVAGPLFGNFLFHEHRHRDSATASILGALVGVAVVLGLFLLVMRRHPRLLAGEGWFSAPLVVGLGRKQRRAAARAVRRLHPSDNALLRAAEQDLARRSVRQRRRSVAIFVILVPLLALFGLLGNVTTAGRIYFLAGAILLAGVALWTAYFARRAKSYLEFVDRTA